MRYDVNMYDKNEVALYPGDFVEAYQRQISGGKKLKTAIIGDIDPQSALLLFSDNGLPIPFSSLPQSLRKLEIDTVSSRDIMLLSAAKVAYEIMVKELGAI